MAKTYEELLEQAAIIRDETAAGKNTATRVGGTITDAVDYVKELQDTYKGIHAEAAEAKTEATAAKNTAADAKMNATLAMNTARSASLNATAASGTANEAKAKADAAQESANTAQQTADAAQETATAASTAAQDAKSAADNANNIATEAKTKNTDQDERLDAIEKTVNGNVIDTSFKNIGYAYGENGMVSVPLFKCTDALPFYEGKSYSHIKTNKMSGVNNLVFLDADKQYLGYSYYASSQSSVIQILNYSDSFVPEGTAFVAFNTYSTTNDAEVIDLTIDKGLRGDVESLKKIPELIRNIIYINKDDDNKTILDKLVQAYNNGNTDVIFEFGEYIIDSAYDNMYNDYPSMFKSKGVYELPLGGNCVYYLNGSKIISNYTGSLVPSGARNTIGSIRTAGSYEIHDGEIIANTGCAYCIHDESQGGSEPYVRKYYNIKMLYIAQEGASSIIKCIGGGLGQHGTIVIDACEFLLEGKEYIGENVPVVSYHGINNNDVIAYSRIVCKNSYLQTYFEAQTLSAQETADLMFCGNSCEKEVVYKDKWTVNSWNNTIHVE